jgi:DNA-directed RNA polymerase subunit RPC12/RpoP
MLEITYEELTNLETLERERKTFCFRCGEEITDFNKWCEKCGNKFMGLDYRCITCNKLLRHSELGNSFSEHKPPRCNYCFERLLRWIKQQERLKEERQKLEDIRKKEMRKEERRRNKFRNDLTRQKTLF